ncbi:unnamed protein product [Lota lota]
MAATPALSGRVQKGMACLPSRTPRHHGFYALLLNEMSMGDNGMSHEVSQPHGRGSLGLFHSYPLDAVM